MATRRVNVPDGQMIDLACDLFVPDAVIGDAGHCAALLSGMGTTLAMVSAEILATTWTEYGGNMEAASSAYHARLRPYVEQCQAFAHEGAPIMVPATQQACRFRIGSRLPASRARRSGMQTG